MEDLMQYVWQFRLWPVHDMRTNQGKRIEVLDPGLLNRDSGPDFFNAKVLIDSIQWIGNIEIHVKASDWYRHHHDTDKAYDSVILHVVDDDDAVVHRSDGQEIPQMSMKCAPDFSTRYHEMVNNTFRELPCGNEINSLPGIYVTDWLTSLAFERLYAKADRVSALLEKSGGDWSEAIYVTLARALGFSTNSDPFQMLAMSTPLKHMLHYTDSLVSIEAFLFGQAGMLDGLDPGQDAYLIRLIDEYKFLKAKYSLQPSKNIMWKMARMRPQNFPHRRIATLAQLIYRNFVFSNKLLEVKSEQEARDLFDIPLQGYWATHYNFSSDDSKLHQGMLPAEVYEAPKLPRNALSNASVSVLLINVVVPVILAYAMHTGNLKRQEFAIDLLHSLKPESNRIIEMYSRAGLEARDAFTTQAMIQLKREYCESRKCLFCRIGHKLLSQKVKRAGH